MYVFPTHYYTNPQYKNTIKRNNYEVISVKYSLITTKLFSFFLYDYQYLFFS